MKRLTWILGGAFFLLLLVGYSGLGLKLIERALFYKPFPENNQAIRFAPGPLDADEHYFGASNFKDFYAYYVKGDSCDNLTFTSFVTYSNDGLTYGAALSPREKKIRNEWHKERRKRVYAPLMCLPPVKNVKKYLESSKTIASWDGIYTEDGLLFVYKPEKVSHEIKSGFTERAAGLPKTATPLLGRYSEITKVFACSERANEFCAHLDIYVYNFTTKRYQIDTSPGETGDYRVFCWECARLKKMSPKQLQAAILFRAHQNYVLKDGMMVPQQALGFPVINADTRKSLEKTGMNVDQWVAGLAKGGNIRLEKLRKTIALARP